MFSDSLDMLNMVLNKKEIRLYPFKKKAGCFFKPYFNPILDGILIPADMGGGNQPPPPELMFMDDFVVFCDATL